MISKEKVTIEEFISDLKKSKYIIFQTNFDDVASYVNGFGNKFKIVKVKKGIVKTSVDGFTGYRFFKIDFLKYWLDEYKIKLEL
jgi:hypothetical protein